MHTLTAYLQELVAVPISHCFLVPWHADGRGGCCGESLGRYCGCSNKYLIKFAHHCEKGGEQAGVSAQWQAQRNTTQTHSEVVMPRAKLFLHAVCCNMFAENMNVCGS